MDMIRGIKIVIGLFGMVASLWFRGIIGLLAIVEILKFYTPNLTTGNLILLLLFFVFFVVGGISDYVLLLENEKVTPKQKTSQKSKKNRPQ